MRYVLLVLAAPVAVVAYLVTSQLIAGLGLPPGVRDLLVIFLPLLVAGLVAVPLIAPFVDHVAKQALANAPRTADRDPSDPDDTRP